MHRGRCVLERPGVLQGHDGYPLARLEPTIEVEDCESVSDTVERLLAAEAEVTRHLAGARKGAESRLAEAEEEAARRIEAAEGEAERNRTEQLAAELEAARREADARLERARQKAEAIEAIAEEQLAPVINRAVRELTAREAGAHEG